MEHEINYVTQTRCSILFFIVLPRGGMSHASQKLRTVGTLLLFKKKTNDVTDFFGVFFFIFFVSSFFVIDS